MTSHIDQSIATGVLGANCSSPIAAPSTARETLGGRRPAIARDCVADSSREGTAGFARNWAVGPELSPLGVGRNAAIIDDTPLGTPRGRTLRLGWAVASSLTLLVMPRLVLSRDLPRVRPPENWSIRCGPQTLDQAVESQAVPNAGLMPSMGKVGSAVDNACAPAPSVARRHIPSKTLAASSMLHAPATCCGNATDQHPESYAQQARNLVWELDGAGKRVLIHDHDAKSAGSADRVVEAAGMRMIKTPIGAPKANAHNGAADWVWPEGVLRLDADPRPRSSRASHA
jgi:hypothetical protein